MKYIHDNASGLKNQNEYDEQYNAVTEKYKAMKEHDEDLAKKISDKASRRAAAEEFLKE